MISYRLIDLDLSGSGDPYYGICEVTLDAKDRIVAWSSAGIRFRAESAAGLLNQVHELRAAFDKGILKESVLDKQGVKHIVAR